MTMERNQLMHQNWGRNLLYVALWDQRIFPVSLLLKVWSVNQQHSVSWELDRNAETQVPF